MNQNKLWKEDNDWTFRDAPVKNGEQVSSIQEAVYSRDGSGLVKVPKLNNNMRHSYDKINKIYKAQGGYINQTGSLITDDESNDVVDAKLSPGEYVMKRSDVARIQDGDDAPLNTISQDIKQKQPFGNMSISELNNIKIPGIRKKSEHSEMFDAKKRAQGLSDKGFKFIRQPEAKDVLSDSQKNYQKWYRQTKKGNIDQPFDKETKYSLGGMIPGGGGGGGDKAKAGDGKGGLMGPMLQLKNQIGMSHGGPVNLAFGGFGKAGDAPLTPEERAAQDELKAKEAEDLKYQQFLKDTGQAPPDEDYFEDNMILNPENGMISWESDNAPLTNTDFQTNTESLIEGGIPEDIISTQSTDSISSDPEEANPSDMEIAYPDESSTNKAWNKYGLAGISDQEFEALKNSDRPIFMKGGSGSGKTSLASAIAADRLAGSMQGLRRVSDDPVKVGSEIKNKTYNMAKLSKQERKDLFTKLENRNEILGNNNTIILDELQALDEDDQQSFLKLIGDPPGWDRWSDEQKKSYLNGRPRIIGTAMSELKEGKDPNVKKAFEDRFVSYDMEGPNADKARAHIDMLLNQSNESMSDEDKQKIIDSTVKSGSWRKINNEMEALRFKGKIKKDENIQSAIEESIKALLPEEKAATLSDLKDDEVIDDKALENKIEGNIESIVGENKETTKSENSKDDIDSEKIQKALEKDQQSIANEIPEPQVEDQQSDTQQQSIANISEPPAEDTEETEDVINEAQDKFVEDIKHLAKGNAPVTDEAMSILEDDKGQQPSSDVESTDVESTDVESTDQQPEIIQPKKKGEMFRPNWIGRF